MAWARTQRRQGGMTREEFAALAAPEPLDLAAATGWDVDTIRQMIRTGALPAIKVGARRVVINRRFALALIDGEPVEEDEPP